MPITIHRIVIYGRLISPRHCSHRVCFAQDGHAATGPCPPDVGKLCAFFCLGDFIEPVLEPRLSGCCAIAPLTEVEVVSAKPIADAAVASEPVYPTLARAVRLAAHLQDTRLCEQIARLGQQTASERFAHLMLELHHRLGLIGQVNDHSFFLPLTQNVLGDVLGLSAVHLNRTLKQLCRDGLLKMESGRMMLLQFETLRIMAGWIAS